MAAFNHSSTLPIRIHRGRSPGGAIAGDSWSGETGRLVILLRETCLAMDGPRGRYIPSPSGFEGRAPRRAVARRGATMSELQARFPELLGKLQFLSLVIRRDIVAVKSTGPFLHRLVEQAADHLSVLQGEGRLVAANLQHAARGRVASEARIEESRVMDAELSHHRQIGGHLSRVARRDRHGLPADEDVEGAGVEDDPPVTGPDRRPELVRRVVADAVEVDHARMGGSPASRRDPGTGRPRIPARPR